MNGVQLSKSSEVKEKGRKTIQRLHDIAKTWMANLWISHCGKIGDEGKCRPLLSSRYPHQLMSTYSHYIAHERGDEHVIQFDIVILQYVL